MSEAFMTNLLAGYPQYFDSIIKNKDDFGVQIIYTRIDRKRKGNPDFTDHYFNVKNEKYFYPASTVKLPVAILALQKLRELNIPGLDMNTTMVTFSNYSGQSEVFNDPSSPDGRPTIAHYIKKILLVSDNDAFNRLYEFLGQEYINNTLHKMGYSDVQIIHRLSISLSEDENRHTNSIRFIDTSGNMIYERSAENSQLIYEKRNETLGIGYYSGDELISEPMDFSKKNKISLSSLHSILRSILFPLSVNEKQQFNLSDEDYNFLRKYMSMRPAESASPVYDPAAYWDNYVKMIFYGSAKTSPDEWIRIFNKTGTAYGFLTDVAYLADFKNKIEFMVSAVIYCNSDGILNDNKYDYTTIGYPFLRDLGRVIYEHELNQHRKSIPDLTSLRFVYTD